MIMARRSGFTRRGKAVVKNNIWTSVLLNEVLLVAGATSTSSIVNAADWSEPPIGQRATILTVRGWVSVTAQADTLTKSEGQVFWYIGTLDALIAVAAIPAADLVSTYVQANIMDTGGFIASSVLGGVGGLAAQRSHDWFINLKTMRTIRSGTSLVFVITNGTGDDIRVGGVFRALLRKGGN